jgi:beta-lactamase superfamily II metal-dependent hydrolase
MTSNPGNTAAAEPKPRRGTLRPPSGGAVVRMYRIGHGDCFLLGFDGDEDTVFVLIDCGYKPGSSPKGSGGTADDVVADIREATGGHIDVAVITHEHQDHVNGITEGRFQGITIGETWMAWTESGSDALAQILRARHRDRLQALMRAQGKLAALPAGERTGASVAELLALEIGGEAETATTLAAFAAGQFGAWTNKDAMQLFRRRAQNGTRFLYPHQEIVALPGAPAVRVFPLGPPRDEKKLADLQPRDGEKFGEGAHGDGDALGFFAAAPALEADKAPDPAAMPFAPRFTIPREKIALQRELAGWYRTHYGPLPRDQRPARQAGPPVATPGSGAGKTAILGVLADDAEARRIEADWLFSAEALALDMGNDTNNGSLVLAFELGRGGKVLLFAADAQRGNWASWADAPFPDGAAKVDVRELLGRTVLYKVGHHGSHNATLKGEAADAVPNLAWLGRGAQAEEFTAMIPAVRSFAMSLKKPWDHPLPAIRDALLEKCRGRVLQTDTDLDPAKRPEHISAEEWAAFGQRVEPKPLYFDCSIPPSPIVRSAKRHCCCGA